MTDSPPQISDAQIANFPLPFWQTVANLIYESHLWIERKVDCLSFDSTSGGTKLSTSYDLWLPVELQTFGWIPLTNFKKETLKDFSIRSGSGASLATLVREDNVKAGAALLGSGCDPKAVTQETKDFLTKLVNFPNAPDGDPKLKLAHDEEKAHILLTYKKMIISPKPDTYRFLSEMMIDGFILWVQPAIDHIGDRRIIIKVSREVDLQVPKSQLNLFKKDKTLIELGITTGTCSSYHLEVKAPVGMLVGRLQIVEKVLNTRPVRVGDLRIPSQIGHVNMKGGNHNPEAIGIFSILVWRGGFSRFVMNISFIVFTLLSLSLLNYFLPGLSRAPLVTESGKIDALGSTIILVGPAIIMLFLASQMEHRIISAL